MLFDPLKIWKTWRPWHSIGFRRMAVFCEHLFSPCSAGSIEIPKLPLQDCHMLFMTKSLGATGKDAPKGGRDGCKMCWLAADPGWWRVRLQTWVMWLGCGNIAQHIICTISLLPSGPHSPFVHSLFLPVQPRVSCMMAMTVGIRRLQTALHSVAIQTSLILLRVIQRLAVTPQGCFTHLCAKSQICKISELIDHFLLCYIKRAVRNT